MKSNKIKKNSHMSRGIRPQIKKKISQNNQNFPKGRVVIGYHSVQEAFHVFPHAISEFWFSLEETEENLIFKKWIEICQKHKIVVKKVQPQILKQFVDNHQGVCVFVKEKPKVSLEKLEKKEKSIVLILDNISDPQNLGSILRTSWLMGVDCIFVSENQGVGLVPSAVKVSSGGSEHVPLEVVTNLNQTIGDLKKRGYWIYGLAGEADECVYSVAWDSEKIALVIGSEEKGIRPLIRKNCDILLSIPQAKASASYNAAVAAAIVLAFVNKAHSE